MKGEWHPVLVAVVLCFCVGAGFGFVQSPASPWLPYKKAINNQWPGHESDPQADQQKRQTSENPAVNQPLKSARHEIPERCYEGEKQGECAARIVQEGAAGLYPWIAVAAGLQAIGAMGTLWLINRQLNVTRAQLRAYVLIENAWAKKTDDPNIRNVVFKIKNSGATPAHKTRVIAISGVVENPITKFPTPIDGANYGTIGPNGDFVDCDTELVTGFTDEDITEERKAIVLVGKITYQDAFNRKRWSDFCYVITGSEAENGEMGIHDTGNDSI
jgi:hypothetical protein